MIESVLDLGFGRRILPDIFPVDMFKHLIVEVMFTGLVRHDHAADLFLSVESDERRACLGVSAMTVDRFPVRKRPDPVCVFRDLRVGKTGGRGHHDIKSILPFEQRELILNEA